MLIKNFPYMGGTEWLLGFRNPVGSQLFGWRMSNVGPTNIRQVDFRVTMTGNKKRYFILIKDSIQQKKQW